MRGVYLETGTLHVQDDLPVPVPSAGEALVQVRTAGICATDIELLRGYVSGFRGIPGHEFVGVVTAHPDPGWVGRRVVGEINIACGACVMCRRGLRKHCLQRRVLGLRGHNGAFAEYLTLPAENLYRVPDDLPDEMAVFTEPLAAALQVLETGAIGPADRVLVLGDGKLGLLVAQVAALAGPEVFVIGRHPERWHILRARGITAIEDAGSLEHSADVVIECTGRPEGITAALRLVRPQGAIILKSTFAGTHPLNLSEAVVNEVRVIGSRCGPFEPALRLLARRQVAVEPLIEAVYPLAQAEQAFAHAGRRGARKILLRVTEA